MSRFIRGNVKFTSKDWLSFEVSYHRGELKFVVDGMPIASYKQVHFYKIRQFVRGIQNILKRDGGGEE